MAMKSVQDNIACYFGNFPIVYVSPKEKTKSKTYKERKQESIDKCKEILGDKFD